MGKFVMFLVNNYFWITVVTLFFVLALVGYIRKNYFSKNEETKFSYKDLKTDIQEIEVKENKSLKEMIKKESVSALEQLNK